MKELDLGIDGKSYPASMGPYAAEIPMSKNYWACE